MIVQNEHKNRGVGLGSEDDNKESRQERLLVTEARGDDGRCKKYSILDDSLPLITQNYSLDRPL